MTTFVFDPDRVASAEARGWRAYYDRDWLKMLRLLVALNQAQFHIPFPISFLAAYDVVRASVAFAPAQHAAEPVRAFLVKFYQLARRYSGLRFDPARAAELELAYWDVHRRLVGLPDKAEFVEVLTALHGELFGLTPAQARASAELRVEANNLVDGITGGTSRDAEGDWARLEAALQRCYRSLADELRQPA